MNISILGIGTELTSGQILNRNGQWISQQMREFGVPTSMHLVVPDETKLILESLEFCAKHSDILFVTGGLGPTSDDFTRDVISQWTEKKLVWDEASWKHIQDRLVPRGFVVKEIQKQQCYFPEGSKVLTNRVGTANAFRLEHQGKVVFVLPGPPREIESVWQDHIAPEMKEKTRDVDALITQSWDTIGWGESDIADRAEAALKGCTFEKGYRVHIPFVEFKITYLKSQSTEAAKWIKAIDEALGPMTVLKNNQDAASELSHLLLNFDQVLIQDEIAGSFLLQRLFPFCKALLKEKKLSFTNSPSVMDSKSETLVLHLKENSAGTALATFNHRGQTKLQEFKSPYQSNLMKDREQQYFAEMALIFWMKEAQKAKA